MRSRPDKIGLLRSRPDAPECEIMIMQKKEDPQYNAFIVDDARNVVWACPINAASSRGGEGWSNSRGRVTNNGAL